MGSIVLGFALLAASALLTYGLIRLLFPLMERYALARPNARSSHITPTPQGAGIAVLASLVIVVALALLIMPLPGDAAWRLAGVLAAAVAMGIVGAIDDMMVRDGWDPRTPEYYDELDNRVARRLPHLAQKGKGGNGADDDLDDDPGDGGGARKPGGPRFRVGGRERPLKSNEVHISRERREAMEEAGVWEDPVLRKNYLKRYAEWDKEHANEA